MESNVWVVGENYQWEFCLPSALWARDGIGQGRAGLVGRGQVTAADDPRLLRPDAEQVLVAADVEFSVVDRW